MKPKCLAQSCTAGLSSLQFVAYFPSCSLLREGGKLGVPALVLRSAQFMPWLRVGVVLSKRKPLTLVTFFSPFSF